MSVQLQKTVALIYARTKNLAINVLVRFAQFNNDAFEKRLMTIITVPKIESEYLLNTNHLLLFREHSTLNR